MEDYRKLIVWRKAHLLLLDVYRHTRSFPAEERYGLTSQLRRAALAVPNNIAEGCGRNMGSRSNKELIRSCRNAGGEINEVDYLLLVSFDLHYLDRPTYVTLRRSAREVRRMLARFIKGLDDVDRGNV